MFSTREIIDLAIRIEENGAKLYRGAMKQVSDPSLVSLLQWMADEEVRHAEWFSRMKGSLEEAGHDPRLEEMGRSLLQGILGDQTFSLKETDFSKLHQVRDLIETAMEFERDTILFYEILRPLVSSREGLDHLDRIIQEENHHIQVLRDLLESPVLKQPPTPPS
jgi:rubrerythrin